jgi:hypothetical protein
MPGANRRNRDTIAFKEKKIKKYGDSQKIENGVGTLECLNEITGSGE